MGALFPGTGSQQVTGLSVEQPVLVNTRLLSRRDAKNFFRLLSSSCCCLFSAFVPQILSILLPWQEEVSQCAQGSKKNPSKIGYVSAFLYMFQFFLAVYSARHTGSYYIKMLFLVINPRHGGCSWHFPSNLLFSLVNSYLIAHSPPLLEPYR